MDEPHAVAQEATLSLSLPSLLGERSDLCTKSKLFHSRKLFSHQNP